MGYEKLNKHKEMLHIVDGDIHSLILGATGSGKTRSLLLQSIGLIALAGESMILSDPKGELHDCVRPFLEELGYKVCCLNFKTPTKSQSYNFLQLVIDAMNRDDIPKAVELVWDIASSLVPAGKAEPIWENGEASIIAGAIMAVVYDNRNRPELQNMTNVFHFINVMCKAGKDDKMPLDAYVRSKGSDHPAVQLFAVALLAPSRTRGSFFTAALTKLRLFTSPYVYNMTRKSDFSLDAVGNEKHAIFIILPDGKATYNSLASLFVFQQYHALLENADSIGGRLKLRTNFMLEEFGNFTKIPGFTQMITVARGRGIKFNLVIQSFEQLDDVYGREQSKVIRDNCDCLIYLRSANPDTNADISRRLGKYTTSSYGRSNNTTSKRSVNSSASMNLIARDLLTPDEVKQIERPYVLVMLSGHDPTITIMPDISKWFFNEMYGMGDEEHNKQMRMHRGQLIPIIPQGDMILWDDLVALWGDGRPLGDEVRVANTVHTAHTPNNHHSGAHTANNHSLANEAHTSNNHSLANKIYAYNNHHSTTMFSLNIGDPDDYPRADYGESENDENDYENNYSENNYHGDKNNKSNYDVANELATEEKIMANNVERKMEREGSTKNRQNRRESSARNRQERQKSDIKDKRDKREDTIF